MDELKIFENPEFGSVRTITENGKTLFCGSDVAKALGYAKPRNAIAAHCKGALKRGIPTNGGVQEMLFITEGDIYRLAARSELPGADKFESWIFDEVLPSIRATSGYISGQEEMEEEALIAKALEVAHKVLERREAKIKELQTQNQIMKPKAAYFDQLIDRNTLTNFRETAKELKVSPKKFVDFLLDNGYLYRDQKGKLLPYEATNDGLLELKECKSNRNQWSGTQTLVTPKGRETFSILCKEL